LIIIATSSKADLKVGLYDSKADLKVGLYDD
jgi:hypothetical protein